MDLQCFVTKRDHKHFMIKRAILTLIHASIFFSCTLPAFTNPKEVSKFQKKIAFPHSVWLTPTSTTIMTTMKPGFGSNKMSYILGMFVINMYILAVIDATWMIYNRSWRSKSYQKASAGSAFTSALVFIHVGQAFNEDVEDWNK